MTMADFFQGNAGRRLEFLARIGWADALATLLSEDMANRRYWRLTRSDGTTRLLMESVPDASPLSTPGHRQQDFIRIGQILMEAGLSVPTVYDGDLDLGFLLIDDFGDTTLAERWQIDPDACAPHETAIDALAILNAIPAPHTPDLPRYVDSYVHTGRRRLVDWWLPCARRAPNDSGMLSAYLAAWDQVMHTAEERVGPCPQGFMHVDYHADNLMWLPDRAGVRRCGILDFQAAMRGPRGYDLGNLVEDPRHPVPAAMADRLRARYWAGLHGPDLNTAEHWYRIFVTQFHGRVMGQYIKLAFAGKTRYLAYLPQAQAYFQQALGHSALAPVCDFFAHHRIDVMDVPVFDATQRILIDADAF